MIKYYWIIYHIWEGCLGNVCDTLLMCENKESCEKAIQELITGKGIKILNEAGQEENILPYRLPKDLSQEKYIDGEACIGYFDYLYDSEHLASLQGERVPIFVF